MPIRWGVTFVDLSDAGIAALLGTVEGITEFLPISSTGHLILLDELLGFQGPPGHVFEVVIQLGAILGVCWVYRERLLQLATRPLMPRNRHLLLLLLLGFLPAAVIGFLAHGFIKTVLFNPWVVSIALIVGGVAIIIIERLLTGDRFKDIDTVPGSVGLKVGFCQALAMIPGVSRSGATIMGARVLGLSRGVAAEFSFLLAIPTMFAATGYDLYKNAAQIDGHGMALVLIGFICALVTAVLTVRWLIGFVSSHTFSGFGWYRIVLGSLMIVLLSFGWG
jgi:undecaprenyl-diphosphatase